MYKEVARETWYANNTAGEKEGACGLQLSSLHPKPQRHESQTPTQLHCICGTGSGTTPLLHLVVYCSVSDQQQFYHRKGLKLNGKAHAWHVESPRVKSPASPDKGYRVTSDMKSYDLRNLGEPPPFRIDFILGRMDRRSESVQGIWGRAWPKCVQSANLQLRKREFLLHFHKFQPSIVEFQHHVRQEGWQQGGFVAVSLWR